jgi:hypothetical protein
MVYLPDELFSDDVDGAAGKIAFLQNLENIFPLFYV